MTSTKSNKSFLRFGTICPNIMQLDSANRRRYAYFFTTDRIAKHGTGTMEVVKTKTAAINTRNHVFFAFKRCKFKNKCSRLMKEQISQMNDEVFGLAAMFKEMDANHRKIKEDCEKREPKLTTNFRRNIPVRQRR